MSFPKSSLFPRSAAVNRRGHLELGGCDVVDLVARYGSPLYVFDEAELVARCRVFREKFEARYPETRVAYACKAFINIGLARLLAQQGLGFDVVSGGEMAVLQAAGVDPATVYFHGNNKSADELRQALEWGIGQVVVDNFRELELLDRLAKEAGRRQPVLLRVSPGVDPYTHVHTTTGVLDSKFGFPVQTGQAAKAVRSALSTRHLDLQGLHFHLGSPIFEVEPYVVAVRRVMEFAFQMREEGLTVREFSPGGGFAVAYTEAQRPPAIAEYAEAIAGAVRAACHDLGMALPRLVIESGRAITGPACAALYTVGSTKEIPGVRTYVSVDGGMGDNIRPALYDAIYEVVSATRMNEPSVGVVTIAGKFCESGDVLVRDAPMPRLEAGDLVAIPTSGAYHIPMASNYNVAPRPAIVLVRDGQAMLLRRRETYEDLMRTDAL